jgi:uncharacterized membrane protein YbhN (UPF0104 family)
MDSDPATRDPARRRARRVRRPADLLIGIVAIASVAIMLAFAHGAPIGARELTGDVSSWLTRNIPRGPALALVALIILGCLALGCVAIVTLLRTDVRDLRNALVAAVLGTAIAAVCVIEWHGHRSGVATAMLHGTNPTVLISTAAFMAFLTGTDLTRRPRWSRWCAVAVVLLPLSEMAVRDVTLFAMVAAPVGGWGIGLLTRWALTAGSVRPASAVVTAWLQRTGTPVSKLVGTGGQGRFEGRLEGGGTITVLLANRDTRGSGIIRRLWQAVRLRDSSFGAVFTSSRTQLEHQALASYVAAGIGVVATRVLLLAEMPPDTLVHVIERPQDSPPTERAQPGASELTRRLDIAQALTTLVSIGGAPAAVEAFRAGYRPEDDPAVAAILQPIALAPWGWAAMRSAKGYLAEARAELAVPDTLGAPMKLERFRWRTVLSAVGLTVAGYVLVGQLSKVNLIGAFAAMIPGWFAVAVAASTLTYFGAALNLAAFVPKRVSLMRGFWVQLATAFVGVAMPPTVGHIAVNSRYLHRQGVDEDAVAAAVGLSQIVNVLATIPLFIVIGILTGSGISKFKIVPGADVLIAAACIVGSAMLFIAIPPTRAILAVHVWPHLRTVIPRLLEAVSQPLRLVISIAGDLILTTSYIVALYASLLALGAHPSVLATAAVYLAGNTVGSFAPTPGGLGAVELVLTAGLTGIGISAHEAVAAVLLFRVATFWLPIPVGWVSFVILQRHGTL